MERVIDGKPGSSFGIRNSANDSAIAMNDPPSDAVSNDRMQFPRSRYFYFFAEIVNFGSSAE